MSDELIETQALLMNAEGCIARLRVKLELIAAPMRPDGTWNRDREACRQLALAALQREDEPGPLSVRGLPWPPEESLTPATRMFDPLERA